MKILKKVSLLQISCSFLKKLNPFSRDPSAESSCICRNRKFNCNLSYKYVLLFIDFSCSAAKLSTVFSFFFTDYIQIPRHRKHCGPSTLKNFIFYLNSRFVIRNWKITKSRSLSLTVPSDRSTRFKRSKGTTRMLSRHWANQRCVHLCNKETIIYLITLLTL